MTMLTGRKQVVLADIESTQSVSNGDRTKRVTRAKVLAAMVELVGVNTAQLGQVQGFRLTNSVEIDRVQYGGEKYLYFGGTLYAVGTLGKAGSPAKMLLNVAVHNDAAAAQAVKEWIDANLSYR